MQRSHTAFPYETTETMVPEDRLGDFLSPEQRLDAIADILSTLAYRALKNDHDSKKPLS